MGNLVNKDVFLTLKWIKGNEHAPKLFQVAFCLEDISNSSSFQYVTFSFSSFDLMYVYLKDLTRAFGICFIDNLFSGKYKVKIEYEENFNSFPVFKKLYIADNTAWPLSSAQGYFLWDFGD